MRRHARPAKELVDDHGGGPLAAQPQCAIAGQRQAPAAAVARECVEVVDVAAAGDLVAAQPGLPQRIVAPTRKTPPWWPRAAPSTPTAQRTRPPPRPTP